MATTVMRGLLLWLLPLGGLILSQVSCVVRPQAAVLYCISSGIKSSTFAGGGGFKAAAAAVSRKPKKFNYFVTIINAKNTPTCKSKKKKKNGPYPTRGVQQKVPD